MNYYISEPNTPAEICIIWLHGLGANAQDMQSLVTQLPKNSLAIRHIFLDAPMRAVTINNNMIMPAWYDITGFTLAAREDAQGLSESEAKIRSIIEQELMHGLTADKIFLAGFSQGGAMALYTALNYPGTLAGVIALSAYLPLSQNCKALLNKKTPIFMAAGTCDPVVLPAWSQFSKNWVENAGYVVAWHEYPIEHSICFEEIRDLNYWIETQTEVRKNL